MIHGGIPKTRITHRRNDSKKGFLLSMTLVLFIIGALAIMMFTGDKEDETGAMDTSNRIDSPSNDFADAFSDSTNGDTNPIGSTELTPEDNRDDTEQEDVPDFFIHVIKAGENFTVLAKKYYNDTRKVRVIERANPNVIPNRIQIGDKIKVPNLNKTNTTSTETNSSSDTNSTEPRGNNGLSGWKKSKSTAEPKKSADDNNRPEHPFGRQEQPSVPDDENVGTLVKVVIREKTTHIASPGDSSIGLALQYYGSYNLKTLIEKANPLFDWYNIKGGEPIVIPEYSEMKVISPKPEKDLSQKRDETSGEPVIEEKPIERPVYEMYTVKKGESLWVIAQNKLGNGTRYKEIMKLNNMTSDVVNEGMRIKIPKR